MIANYCNQTAVLKHPTGYTSAAGDTMQVSTIRVRFEPYTRQIIDTQGRIITSEARVFTASAVKAGDTLTYASREWTVRNVKAHPGLNGSIDHYEVLL